jgi:hypothetical protein
MGCGQFSHTFSGGVYDFYNISPEYFGYTLISAASVHTAKHTKKI